MLGRRKDNGRGIDMLGKRNPDGTPASGSETPPAGDAAGGPRMYRTDSAMTPVTRPPVVDVPRRAADVTAVTGRRAEVQPGDDRDAKKLVVGRGIALSGEIRACDRLIVEGQVEATLSDSRSIEISTSGVFKGKAQIEEAEISGRFDGELVVSQKLIIHATGRVVGNVRYGEIEIARGGIISGQIDVITGASANASSSATTEAPAAAQSEPQASVSASIAQGELSVS
jgi:cytoskeletal protein CcmA (bactofilin family)